MLDTLREFHTDALKLCKVYNNLEIVYWIEAFWCLLRYGASPNDYIRYEFIKCEMILEECITQHDIMSTLNPYSVNTIRVYTIVDKNGRVIILDSLIRMGVTKACVDNASAGGIFSSIDLNTGVINSIATDYKKNKYIIAPMTGDIIVGKSIPSWNLVIELATNVAKELLGDEKKYIAMDIAIMSNGMPELIEVNWFGGPAIRQLVGGYPVGKWMQMREMMK